jgi:hypothetical protein
MADSNVEVFRRVQAHLSSMTAPQKRVLPITEDTEVYRDLKIYGDEIVALVWWLEKGFGVAPNINPFDYAPREFPFSWAWRAIRKVTGSEPAYKLAGARHRRCGRGQTVARLGSDDVSDLLGLRVRL